MVAVQKSFETPSGSSKNSEAEGKTSDLESIAEKLETRCWRVRSSSLTFMVRCSSPSSISCQLPLELVQSDFYRSEMKQISLFLAIGLLAAPAISRAQDAATEERLNKLSARIDVLIEAKDAQNKRIEELARAVEALQQQINKPGPNYASQEDLKNLADKLREVDQKRQDDNERILAGIKRELKNFSVAASRSVPERPAADTTTPIPDKGYEYVIQSGDTISAIVSAYRDQGIKVTTEQILNANPGLKATSLRVGQKIFIPAPNQ